MARKGSTMKKYPKNLADAVILVNTIENLYERAESFEMQAEEYKNRLKKDEEADWLRECIEEAEAKMNACIRLAEKLAK